MQLKLSKAKSAIDAATINKRKLRLLRVQACGGIGRKASH
jgi:hypothetical protein